VFPCTKHRPSELLEEPRLLCVTGLVDLDLCGPVRLVGSRPRAVLEAAVPEAPVDEHREARSGEDDVGPDCAAAWNVNGEIDAEATA
jgi:hypothetical protein